MSEPKIKTRSFQYGDEKESEWPPQFGTNKGGYVGYWDPIEQKMKEGYPPPKIQKFGEAPYVIQDEIEPYYHPSAQCMIDSKSRLKAVDKALGTITTDKKLPPNPSRMQAMKKEREKDIREAMLKSVAQIDSGTAPLNEEQREMCKRENERVSNLLGFDAFNVVGRKNDPRGKKYRRK